MWIPNALQKLLFIMCPSHIALEKLLYLSTDKQLEIHGCVLSTVATDALVPLVSTMLTKISIVLDQFLTKMLHL